MSENKKNPGVTIFYNLAKAELVEHAIKRDEGVLSETGALITNTKKYTGRSPNDKFTVVDDITKDKVWFSDINKQMSPDHANMLADKIKKYLADRTHYVIDCAAGASAEHAIKVRVHTERAWHALFARNMFIDNENSSHEDEPDFQVFHAPGFLAQPQIDKTHSEAAVVLDFTNRHVLICGTEYAGEIKKSIFTVLNFLLPMRDVLTMHCSANKNSKQEVAIFFGLSGTGKTTLSADSSRMLIGDDEHGWDDKGVFNFEGGCYAKVIKLSKKEEPEIFNASHRFSAILENVVYDEKSRKLDLDDDRYTKNTRSSYDISFIPHACLSGKGGHPNHIVMLTCDAFGVLPPVSKLDPAAATYYFINGYTAKVAGTERGISEPEAVFSACFGAPFMAHFPIVYARLLKHKMEEHKISCWLLNTGWTGGPYGVGSRMKISWSRAILHAILEGRLTNVSSERDPIFNLQIPTQVPEIPKEILFPRNTWTDGGAYDDKAKELARLFRQNFKPYSDLLPKEIEESGPVDKDK